MEPKRDRSSAVCESIAIAMFIIGPFILERSNPHAIPWFMALMTALGVLYGFSIYYLKPRRPIFGFAALGIFLAIFFLLSAINSSSSATCLSWAGGYFSGLILGVWPIQRKTEEEARQKKEPAPGWHLNNKEFPASSMVADQALVALRNLDGRTHYFLCVTYGRSRIDIVGDYRRGLVVLCTPDVHLVKNWSILMGRGSDKQTMSFNAGPDHMKLPASNLVDAELAKGALVSFIAHRTPDPTLTWFTGPKAYARRPRSTRVLPQHSWPWQSSGGIRSRH